MANKSGIHIDPSKRGTFTAAAKPGESTQEHAARVLAPGSTASTAMKRKANFARNAAKWSK
jgi:hypothetical protein